MSLHVFGPKKWKKKKIVIFYLYRTFSDNMYRLKLSLPFLPVFSSDKTKHHAAELLKKCKFFYLNLNKAYIDFSELNRFYSVIAF